MPPVTAQLPLSSVWAATKKARLTRCVGPTSTCCNCSCCFCQRASLPRSTPPPCSYCSGRRATLPWPTCLFAAAAPDREPPSAADPARICRCINPRRFSPPVPVLAPKPNMCSTSLSDGSRTASFAASYPPISHGSIVAGGGIGATMGKRGEGGDEHTCKGEGGG